MLMNRRSVAMLGLVLFPTLSFAGKQQGITASAMLGYHYLESANSKQEVALDKNFESGSKAGQAVNNDIAEKYAIGFQFNPDFAVEADYSQTQTTAITPSLNGNKDTHDAREQHYTVNMILSNGTDIAWHLKPYLLIGAGQSVLETKAFDGDRTKINESKDTIANLGVGAFYQLTDNFAARGELRIVRNFDHDWWEGLALLGVHYGWYWGGDKLITERRLVIPPAGLIKVETVPIATLGTPILDSDHDGVSDTLDQCPNTPLGTPVNAAGCSPVTNQTRLKLNVLFDTNKSFVKPQYLPEIRHISNTMTTDALLNATIEGHTDNTGSMALNSRLSFDRANAVRTIMMYYYGVSPTKVSATGYASTKPIANNATVTGRAQNRRVEAYFYQK